VNCYGLLVTFSSSEFVQHIAVVVCFVCRATVDHVKSMFASEGSDAWWSLPLDRLLPRDVIARVTQSLNCVAYLCFFNFSNSAFWFAVYADSGRLWVKHFVLLYECMFVCLHCSVCLSFAKQQMR